MSSLAFISQKGGVGRTTIAVNLSYSLARRGWRVLLVDADLQGGVGFSLTEKSKNARGFLDLLVAEEIPPADALDETVLKTNLPGLDLLTRGTRDAVGSVLANVDGHWASRERLGEVTGMLNHAGYDLVVYDTPSGLGRVTRTICGEVDSLLVPQHPTPLSLRSLPLILRMVASMKESGPAEEGEDEPVKGGPRLAGFVLSMTSTDDPASLDDQREFRDLLPVELVLETVIPFHRDFAEASQVGVPVAMLRERPSSSSLIFDQLAAELEPRLQLGDSDGDAEPERHDYARLVD